jgi:TRAP-type C4-dicarboxylate transport system permease small subunit
MRARPNWFERALQGLHKFEVVLLASILIAMVLVATTQILLRNFFDTGLIWADPLLRAMLLWLGLLGAVVASHDNKHISIDLLSRYAPQDWQRWIRMTTSLFTALVCLIVAYHSGRFVFDEYSYQTPSSIATTVPAWIVEVIIPAAFTLIALRYFLLIGRYWLRKPVGEPGL